ncbi:MAG: hypothetical protein KAH84_01940 [Thiomargarita sp.]|nr:hypothetical protein [Thiomargarita sp.]
MNKFNSSLLILSLILFIPFGCGEDGKATVDVVKKRITDRMQSIIGKGDIAIQKYDNKIEEIKGKLIKVKVSNKTFSHKLKAKKMKLAELDNTQNSETKIALLKDSIQDMENFLEEMTVAEQNLLSVLQKMINQRDLVKMRIETLESKRDMLDAMRTAQQYSTIEIDIENIDNHLGRTFEDMQKEVYSIEAEIEVEKLLKEMDKLPATEVAM